ncbi:hypothetical protein N9973_00330 [bacterium]|nr:hypothetical protein [bacterium]
MDYQATDPELTELIKESDHEEALGLLIERHSGIYVDMVRRYASKYLPSNDIVDIIGDKDLIIYKAALDYDESKAKFSTHVGNKAKYLCLSRKTARKNGRKFLPFDSIDYSEESKDLHPDEGCEKKESFIALIDLIDSHRDDRVKIIFKERYFGGERGKFQTWKRIAEQVGISAQGCINIHDKTLKEFKKQIKKNA